MLIYYDPKIISYDELVIVFFSSHDATTLDRQGPDEGSSYRSVAFYQNNAEKIIIEKTIQRLTEAKFFRNKIVTEVSKLDAFYRAEDYHQNYIEHHPENNYVSNVSIPRFNLFKRTYKGKLKE